VLLAVFIESEECPDRYPVGRRRPCGISKTWSDRCQPRAVRADSRESERQSESGAPADSGQRVCRRDIDLATGPSEGTGRHVRGSGPDRCRAVGRSYSHAARKRTARLLQFALVGGGTARRTDSGRDTRSPLCFDLTTSGVSVGPSRLSCWHVREKEVATEVAAAIGAQSTGAVQILAFFIASGKVVSPRKNANLLPTGEIVIPDLRRPACRTAATLWRMCGGSSCPAERHVG